MEYKIINIHISSGSIFQQTLENIMEFGFPKNLAYSLDLTAFNGEIHRFNQGNCCIQLELRCNFHLGWDILENILGFLEVGTKPEKVGSHLLHREGGKACP